MRPCEEGGCQLVHLFTAVYKKEAAEHSRCTVCGRGWSWRRPLTVEELAERR